MKYHPPKIKTYSSKYLLEHIGPTQTSYVNVQIGATAFNATTPGIIKYVDTTEYRLAKLEVYNIKERHSEIT